MEIKVTGNTPLEALSSLVAFGMHCMKDNGVSSAACRILEAEKHQEQKLAAAQAQETAAQTHNGANTPAPASASAPADSPADPPGPAAGEAGPTAAPSEGATTAPAQAPEEPPAPKPTTGKPPSLEDIRAKGIEAAKKYGQAAVKAILKEFNAENMTALPEDKRAEFLVNLEGLGGGNA